MPKFSAASLKQLSTCHPDLQRLFFEVIKYVDCHVREGYRGEAAQNAAYAAGNSTLKFPNGKHNKMPSNAVDVYFYPIQLKNTKKFYWFVGYVLATAHQLKAQGKISHSIRCGADWDGDHDLDDQTLVDLVHFEIIP